ncbi:site-specific integrase [Gimesia maris]|uniref:tyrosine-type recombinase/integrase n=1 Tax=Gimesia maris TaxID=122 RepID=UPI0030D8FDFF|tara:strand:+ start:40064 stop:41248 length:1185 start_codon:yes stop_codon:yes gene_type:complete
MLSKPAKIPSYCKHKASGQAVVHIKGKSHYLGLYGSPESHSKYHQLIAENFGEKRVECSARGRGSDLTVVELIAAYWNHAKSYYVKNGEPTSEQYSLKLAFRPLKKLYGHSLVSDFGPLSLEIVRDEMIEAGITRSRINQHVGRIRRMFKWGVAKEMLPVEIYQSLMSLDGLKKGRSSAIESKAVKSVAWSIVKKTLPYLPAQIQAMVRIQMLLGCRPSEIAQLRPCDVFDRDQEVWVYEPESHKSEHRDLDRKIFIGRRAQILLKKWLSRDSEKYCFSPKESREQYDYERSQNRRTPHTPSSRSRRRKKRCKKQPGEKYTTLSYGRAIRNACRKAGVESWSPHQLRHTRATIIRKKHGLEASQVVMGHSKADVTQIYAERNYELAKEVVRLDG